ncbi:tRNA pseudouridine(55) synthase TruB [Psychrobacter sp.]|uniref:tRNA pseudouridine(55) synthase TruB n=1 Tax=Psychrobacter sp. TaxID=56811 RepID=UPI0025D0FBE4|nr:tRNA pseudouridine(55) synthase TruB [Psychrobacter sp.]
MGQKSKVSGVILIDKPKGLTSQQVVSKVKYLLKSPLHDSKKAGHTGTLDPMATGLLPVCLGEATKFSHYQLDADKSYQATIKLGVQTDTGDADGQSIAEQEIPNISIEDLKQITAQFLGNIKQTPPMYSALKKEGKKLYEYARAGIEVEREARPITIKEMSLQLTALKDELLLNVTCTKGTYVRVLGEDIALALHTLGHLNSLRRTQVGHFLIAEAISLNELERLTHEQRLAQLQPIDACVTGLPALTVFENQRQRLMMGQRLNVKEQLSDELVEYLSGADKTIDKDLNAQQSCDIKIITTEGDFLGLGELELNGRLQPKKMIQR